MLGMFTGSSSDFRARGSILPIVQNIRRRWRVRIVLRGISITLAAGFAAFLLSAYALEALRFSAGAVATFRVLSWVVVAVLMVVYLIRPLLRRVADDQVALYLEEHEPTLEASILGAIEAERAVDAPGAAGAELTASPELVRRLVERAVERARAVEYGKKIPTTCRPNAHSSTTPSAPTLMSRPASPGSCGPVRVWARDVSTGSSNATQPCGPWCSLRST